MLMFYSSACIRRSRTRKPLLAVMVSLALLLAATLTPACSRGAKTAEAQAHQQAGAALAAKGDWSGAVKEYTEAIKLDPKWYLSYQGRGYAYLKLGDVDLSISDLMVAQNLAPDDTTTYFYRGMAYLAKGVPSNAVADLTRAVGDRNTCRWPEALYERGLAYEAYGKPEDAQADFERIVQIESGAQDSLSKSWLEKAQAELAKLGQ